MNHQKKNSWIWISMISVLCGVISFFVTINLYDNKDIKKEKITMSMEEKEITDLVENKIDAKIEQDKTDKAGDEVTKEKVEETTDHPIIITYQDTSEEVMENIEDTVEAISYSTNDDSSISLQKAEFSWPISGELGMEYALNELIYSKTLDEWITHTGVDIMGEEAAPVKAIFDGVVDSVKLDPRYGNTIIINHPNGFQSVYANLSTTDLVYVGKEVKRGDIISGIGKGFGFECEERPHIHFEMRKENEKINPMIEGNFMWIEESL